MTKEQCLYLGIDVGKYSHQATLINEDGEMTCPSFKFNNNRREFGLLMEAVRKQTPDLSLVRAGMEATGHYYWHLRDYLLDQGLEVVVFNPIETQNKAKKMIRKVKNDRFDSLLIAQITKEKRIKAGEKTNSLPVGRELKEMKELTRFCESLKGQSRYYKQAVSVLLERLCPEFPSNFSQLFLKTPLAIIKGYFLDNLPDKDLVELTIKTSRNRISREKAGIIVSQLNRSLGGDYRYESSKLQLRMLLDNLTMIGEQIGEIKKRIEEKGKNMEEVRVISSVKGVSGYMAGVIAAEIGGIGRFSRKEQLTAYAGLNPSVRQSGLYCRKQGNRISKRGSKHLRKQLYYAAKTAIIFDPELKDYYLKKKAQGKHYNCIMCAVARKILMRIWAVLKQKRPYELRAAQSLFC